MLNVVSMMESTSQSLLKPHSLLSTFLVFLRIQLISTLDESASKRGKCSSIIEINPFDHCNVTRLDPKTVINNMKRDHPGFTIGPSIYLSFRSAFTFLFASSLDGIFFEINPFNIDNILIRANFKAKIDLYSNQCRILASLFSHCPKA